MLCLFGSCGWAAGAHANGTELGPPIIEAWRERGLVIIDGWRSSLQCWLEAACWSRFRFMLRLGEGGLGARGPVYGCLGKAGERGRGLLRDFSQSVFAWGEFRGVGWGG